MRASVLLLLRTYTLTSMSLLEAIRLSLLAAFLFKERLLDLGVSWALILTLVIQCFTITSQYFLIQLSTTLLFMHILMLVLLPKSAQASLGKMQLLATSLK